MDMENEKVMRQLFEDFGNVQDPRRKQERMDFNLIREDKTAIGNLPRTAQHHEIPKAGFWLPTIE
jgi:hypothetical protein